MQLPGPVAEQRCGADHQHWAAAAGELEGDHLDRLAQPHVVGQAAAHPQLAHRQEPGEPAPLVAAQGRLQALRLDRVLRGGDLAEPPAEVGECPLGPSRDDRVAHLHRPGQGDGQGITGPHPLAGAAPQPVDELGVDDDPPVVQAHDAAPPLDQRLHLLAAERGPAEGDLPAEVEQPLEAEARRPVRLQRLARPDHRAKRQCPLGQRRGPAHLDVEARECVGGVEQ